MTPRDSKRDFLYYYFCNLFHYLSHYFVQDGLSALPRLTPLLRYGPTRALPHP